jgi:hypothetical protein
MEQLLDDGVIVGVVTAIFVDRQGAVEFPLASRQVASIDKQSPALSLLHAVVFGY